MKILSQHHLLSAETTPGCELLPSLAEVLAPIFEDHLSQGGYFFCPCLVSKVEKVILCRSCWENSASSTRLTESALNVHSSIVIWGSRQMGWRCWGELAS